MYIWYGEVNGVCIVEWLLHVFSLNYYARLSVESREDEMGCLRFKNSGEGLKQYVLGSVKSSLNIGNNEFTINNNKSVSCFSKFQGNILLVEVLIS